MPAATQIITSFLGGEISEYAQGRYDRPDYRTSMRVCLNSFPLESGAWTRRPGTKYAGHTRGGAAGRVTKFDFEQSAPATLEFTDTYLRFRNGATLITTNDAQVIVAISTANPAVVQTTSAVTWSTGDTAIFPGASAPLLEGRQFKLTKIDTTHFSLAEAITGAPIDGSAIGALAVGATIARVHELVTAYVGSLWQNLRVVQAETTGIILCGTVAPQILSVTTNPSESANAQFAIGAAAFLDGPYLDPFTNGAQVTPSAGSGIITLALSFPAWSATKAYKVGDFVTYSSVNYVSLVDQNVNAQPDVNPAYWSTTSAGAAVNNGQGFLGSDVGRLVRLLSEPTAWASGTTYSAGAVVSFNPSGVAGATVYWTSLQGSNTGHVPGTDTAFLAIAPSGAAIWSWGKVTSLSNAISGGTGTAVGSLIGGGGLSAAFDGVINLTAATCANQNFSGSGLGPGTNATFNGFIGKNYTGVGGKQIKSATFYPSIDQGFGAGSFAYGTTLGFFIPTLTINLRGKASAPAFTGDGTLLATTGPFGNTTSPITLISGDQTTSWNYVWIEIIAIVSNPTFFTSGAYGFTMPIAEMTLFSPTGTGATSGINVEILGPALPYTNTISTWRLGVYSNTTGWPTCGCYDGGRLFLGGAQPNRWDACVSNGISGTTINFAPTDQYGNVAASNALSFTFNSDSVNPILWMSPELQGIVMGTQSGEWLVQAPTSGPLSPTNVSGRRVTKIGCANVEPRRTEHTMVMVKRYGRKLMEYFADVYSGKYSAPNLADKAQHLAAPGIAELAYTEAVTPIVWGRDDAGGLFGITYKRDNLSSAQGPAFYGWHPHTLGSGRTVESICSGPSSDGDLDTLTMVTSDTRIRHVEIMTDVPAQTSTLAEAWFLDDAVNPASITINSTNVVLHGLWHLEGLTVQVFAAGLDLGDPGDEGTNPTDFVVANGSVTITYGDGISAGPGRGLFTRDFATALSLSQLVVGLTYNSDGQIVRLIAQADTGARNGPALGAPSRTHRAAIKFVNSKGVSIGGNFDRLYPCLFRASIDSPRDLPVLATYTGIFFDQVKDDFTYDDSLCWRVSRPFPATITACAQNLRTEDM